MYVYTDDAHVCDHFIFTKDAAVFASREISSRGCIVFRESSQISAEGSDSSAIPKDS